MKYIVWQTVGRWLDEHDYHPAHPPHILDMACGSGSFLIEAFDVMDRRVAQLRGQEIDQLVYGLYSLEPDEIRLVEDSIG